MPSKISVKGSNKLLLALKESSRGRYFYSFLVFKMTIYESGGSISI